MNGQQDPWVQRIEAIAWPVMALAAVVLWQRFLWRLYRSWREDQKR